MVSLKDVTRYYSEGARVVHAVDAAFPSRLRPRVCGGERSERLRKSTLMHLIAGLDKPTSGEIVVGGIAVHEADDNAPPNFAGIGSASSFNSSISLRR
jgi:putative ABC transport system ATP-binding protein